MTEQATELSAIDFTDDEKQLLEATAELYNAFCRLPMQHNSDHPEFVAALHHLQLLILQRPGQRLMLI